MLPIARINQVLSAPETTARGTVTHALKGNIALREHFGPL